MSRDFGLPRHYYVDESDPDILVLRRQDGSFVAAFSAQAATKESIVEAAQEDYQTLRRQLADEHEAGNTENDS
jgi:hypothetical protein